MDIFNARFNEASGMTVFKRAVSSLSLYLVLFNSILSQDSTLSLSSSSRQIATHTEQIFGMDDLLVNGIRYIPENTRVTGSPFFEFADNTEGSGLYIKGHSFNNIPLTLDIASDHLILIQSLENGLQNPIRLHHEWTDSFTLGSHLFINPSNTLMNFTGSGFYEQITHGRVVFLKKYKKTYLKIYDTSNKGKYSPQSSESFLMDKNGVLTPVNTKKAFLKYYKQSKKAIKGYLKEQDFRFRKADNVQLRQLMKFCNGLPDAH